MNKQNMKISSVKQGFNPFITCYWCCAWQSLLGEGWFQMDQTL